MGGGELGVWGLRGGGEDGPSGVSVVVGVGEGEDSGRFWVSSGGGGGASLGGTSLQCFRQDHPLR